MYKEIISASINRLNNSPNLFTGGDGAVRGSFGKINIKNAPACLVLPDFSPPVDMEDSQKNVRTKLQLVCFVIGKSAKSQIEAEDYCLDLAESIQYRLTDEHFEVTRDNARIETNDWMLTDMEWIERKQTGCVIALTFEMELWK